MEISRYLRQHARTIAGKSQLFINSYAKALEVCFQDFREGYLPSGTKEATTVYYSEQVQVHLQFCFCLYLLLEIKT